MIIRHLFYVHFKEMDPVCICSRMCPIFMLAIAFALNCTFFLIPNSNNNYYHLQRAY